MKIATSHLLRVGMKQNGSCHLKLYTSEVCNEKKMQIEPGIQLKVCVFVGVVFVLQMHEYALVSARNVQKAWIYF